MSGETTNTRTGHGITRRKGFRRTWAALPVAALLLLTGCGGDDDKDEDKPAATTSAPAATTQTTPPASGGGTSTAPSSTAPAGGAPSSAAALTGESKEVAENWEKLFNNATPLPERVKLLENGDKMGPLVETLAGNELAKTVTAKVTAVTINGDKADVKFDILLSGTPTLPGQPGIAVKQDGTWKVGLATLCTLVGALGGGDLPEGCPSA